MSQDSIDLLKVLAATALVFAVSTLVMLYLILLLAQYGAGLPVIGSLPVATPPEMVPFLANNQIVVTLAAVHVTAMGLALVLTSGTVDMTLLIVSKAITVIITALLGFVGGRMIFLQLTENASIALQPLTPAVVALIGFFVLSSLLSVQNLRELGPLRFAAALALVLAGPMLLVWL